MSYKNLSNGLYLVKRKAGVKVVDHYGVLDVGDCLGLSGANGVNPIVVHQQPPRIRADWFEELDGLWTVLGVVVDKIGAKQRLEQSLGDPYYDLFGHNCEHFARFVATGKKESLQLKVVGLSLGLSILVMSASR